jgi:TonB family protein
MKPTRTISLLFVLGCAALAAAAVEPSPPKVAGTDVPPPKLHKRVEPSYPEAALREGVSGIVILDLTIDERGAVVATEIVRSIPGLDQAAMDAVRKWQYAVTRVDGKPVRVRQTVPVSFTLRVPEVRRQRGIPELRRGLPPMVPTMPSAPPAVSAVAEITLAPDGSLAAIDLRKGERPWSDALIAALRTWRFTPGDADTVVSFRVEAVFPRSGSAALNLTGLRQVSAATAPAEPSPTATPAATPAGTAASQPTPQAPAAPPTEPAATPSPAAEDEAPVVQAASDVINVQNPAPTPSPTPLTAGTSAIPGITLDLGVPDLLSGRRPVVPPLARIQDVSGTVVVGFSVDGLGHTTVQQSEGPEALREQARQAVHSWAFRQRLAARRLFLVATFTYAGDAASVRVQPRN